jgi:hypothetical protein
LYHRRSAGAERSTDSDGQVKAGTEQTEKRQEMERMEIGGSRRANLILYWKWEKTGTNTTTTDRPTADCETREGAAVRSLSCDDVCPPLRVRSCWSGS